MRDQPGNSNHWSADWGAATSPHLRHRRVAVSPFLATPRQVGQAGAGRGPRAPQEGGGLTEHADVLQVLEERVLELLLPLPGELLRDGAAVAQAGPQPAGRGRQGRSEEGGRGPGGAAPPGTCPCGPQTLTAPPHPLPGGCRKEPPSHSWLQALQGRGLSGSVYSPPEPPDSFPMDPWPSPPLPQRPPRRPTCSPVPARCLSGPSAAPGAGGSWHRAPPPSGRPCGGELRGAAALPLRPAPPASPGVLGWVPLGVPAAGTSSCVGTSCGPSSAQQAPHRHLRPPG